LEAPSASNLKRSEVKIEAVLTSPKEHFSKERSLKNTYSVVFDHWCTLGIMKHKKITDKMKTALKSALKNYSQEEICRAMTNYAEILNGEDYFWRYRWTFDEFLRRGLEKFMDGEVARQNYRRREEGKHGEPARRSPESTTRREAGTSRRHDKEPSHEEYTASLPPSQRSGKQ